MDAELGLREKLLAFSTSKQYDNEIARAFDVFWGGRRQLKGKRLDEADSGRFLEWYLFDYKTCQHGKSLVALYQEFRGYTLPDNQRALLRQWQRTRFGLFEVTGVWQTQIGLRDVFEKDVLTVRTAQGCPLASGDLLLGRVLAVGPTLRLSGTVSRIPAALTDTVMQHLQELFQEYGREVANAFWPTFFRDWGHRVNYFLTDIQDGRCT
jgi:hypothetical protein